jgi:glucosamine--fructose-6-phosphate aminotransferase (isomerizing)
MCGIVGAVAQRDVAPILLEGLSRLEYRGYDSCGICTISNGSLRCIKTTEKVRKLMEMVGEEGCPGKTGIAHTRWATHGVPTATNAHPHIVGTLSMVHNGIIENFAEMKKKLVNAGYAFKSQTDTEVLLAQIHSLHTKKGLPLREAFAEALRGVKGSYALALIDSKDPDTLYAARCGSPLVIGLGIGENFVASDVLALLPVTRRFIYLDEGEIAVLKTGSVKIFGLDLREHRHEVMESDLDAESISKGKYRHFMQKEIFEQPEALQNTAMGRLGADTADLGSIAGLDAGKLSGITGIKIVACGTSYHAGLVGKYWLEELSGISTSVEIASEYRYRRAVVRPGTLFVTISQSGETADTLACLRLAKKQGYCASLCICNAASSSLVRESDFAMLTRAGAEIGVASTKAFTTQLLSLLLITLYLGRARGSLDEEQGRQIVAAIKSLPEAARAVLAADDRIKALAGQFAGKHNCLFLGRGIMYPIALEGALKLKEISYIHAEGYAAGELKHGPIALIDEEMPVVVVAPDNALLSKLESNIEEVRARGGRLYVFSQEGSTAFRDDGQTEIIRLPAADPILQPILFTLPLQQLAYHCAVINGTDVDQPRNLAKSVTVE